MMIDRLGSSQQVAYYPINSNNLIDREKCNHEPIFRICFDDFSKSNVYFINWGQKHCYRVKQIGYWHRGQIISFLED